MSLRTSNCDSFLGEVRTPQEEARAVELARGTKGVMDVVNHLTIVAAVPTTDYEADQSATEKAKEKIGEVVDKTKETLSKTGEVITDGWITTRVHQRFVGEDLLKSSDINVDTNDHVVTLKGTVMSAAGRAKAVEIAKGTEGVHQVVDRLTIGPKAKSGY